MTRNAISAVTHDHAAGFFFVIMSCLLDIFSWTCCLFCFVVYYESLKREHWTILFYLLLLKKTYFIRECRRVFVYYESLKRALQTKTIYGYRCDERLKTNVEESTRLVCTPLCAELEHLKIETRLTSETPVSEMGEYANVM